jgi:hypothetical protein
MAKHVINPDNVTLIQKTVWSHSGGTAFSSGGAMGSSAVAFTGSGRCSENVISNTTLEAFLSIRVC